jgi:holo-ACP synthase
MEDMMSEMLAARERRWLNRKKLVKNYGYPVISVTLNIPGWQKRNKTYHFIFNEVLNELHNCIQTNEKFSVLHQVDTIGADGPEALLVVKGESLFLKKLAMFVEQTYPLGRLVDIDVMNEKGIVISRYDLKQRERECVICGGSTRECIISKKHSTQEVLDVMDGMIAEYLAGERRYADVICWQRK